jgi:hypothetical protein
VRAARWRPRTARGGSYDGLNSMWSQSSRIDIISRPYSFTESCGLVQGHVASCFRYLELAGR